MTAKQKAARAKFKAVVKEANKLRKKNPKLTQAQAVKQAWEISYNKKIGAAAKVKAKKGKKTEMHTDTKSHNVNIRVISGIKINYKKGKLGALPVNFTGNILGLKFRVYNQFNLDGTVTAQIVEDNSKGYLIAELNGKAEEVKRAANIFYGTIERKVTDELNDKEEKIIRSRILKFLDQLNKEVKAYNNGKDKRTKKNEKLIVTKTVEKKPTGVKDKIKDILRNDKKRLKYGYTIVKGRVMSGINNSSIDELKRTNDLIQKWNTVLDTLIQEKKLTKNSLSKTMYKNDIYRVKNVIAELKNRITKIKKNIK